MRLLIITALLVSADIELNGQAPGYLGRANLLTYSVNLNPSIDGVNVLDMHRASYSAYRKQSSPVVSILTRHQVELERSFSRSAAFGVGTFLTRTSQVFEVYRNGEVSDAAVGSQTIGFFPSIKYFWMGRGSIAPVGVFTKFVIGVMHTAFHTELIADSVALAEVESAAVNRVDYFIWLSLGDAIALSPRMILTFAMDIGWGAGMGINYDSNADLLPPAGRAMMPSFQIGMSRTM